MPVFDLQAQNSICFSEPGNQAIAFQFGLCSSSMIGVNLPTVLRLVLAGIGIGLVGDLCNLFFLHSFHSSLSTQADFSFCTYFRGSVNDYLPNLQVRRVLYAMPASTNCSP
jgi:hypothetical protein